jgi:hypothetical protein
VELLASLLSTLLLVFVATMFAAALRTSLAALVGVPRGAGAILAIPLTLLAKALLVDIDPDTRWIGHLLTSGPTPGPQPPESADRRPVADETRPEQHTGPAAADVER